MKKFAMLVLMALSSSMAQTVLSAEECKTFTAWINSYDYTIPSKFPKPSKEIQHVDELKPFDFKCAGNRYINDGIGSFKVLASKKEDFYQLFKDIDGTPNGNIITFIYHMIKEPDPEKGMYLISGYPSIDQEKFSYIGYYLSNKVQHGESILHDYIPPDLIGGYKINGGPLKPYVFEGNSETIKYKKGDILELFFKDIPGLVAQYTKIDTKNYIFEQRTKYPFPEN